MIECEWEERRGGGFRKKEVTRTGPRRRMLAGRGEEGLIKTNKPLAIDNINGGGGGGVLMMLLLLLLLLFFSFSSSFPFSFSFCSVDSRSLIYSS